MQTTKITFFRVPRFKAHSHTHRQTDKHTKTGKSTSKESSEKKIRRTYVFILNAHQVLKTTSELFFKISITYMLKEGIKMNFRKILEPQHK